MTRSYGIVTVTCDECGLVFEVEVYPGYTQRDVTSEVEARGWMSEGEDDVCPDCLAMENEEESTD